MKQLLKDIITDQKKFLANRKLIPRSFPERYLKSEEVIIISGVRRCGKSVLLQQIRYRMPQRDYFMNFDDDRLATFSVEHFQELYEVFVELYGEQNCFYFDEIQNIKGWEQFVRRLYNMGMKVFITGSNARMLSKELGTHLTGCHVAMELFPFTFAEFLLFIGKEGLLKDISGTLDRGAIQAAFESYLLEGGFPMFLKSKDDLVLKTLYENILYKDVMVRNQLVNERELKELVYFVVSNVGKLHTYTSLTKVVGLKNSTTVKSYLEYIENTYLLFSLSKLDSSVKAQLRNPKKVYAIDNALVRRLGFHFSGDEGRLLENLVFLDLRRRGDELFYHNSSRAECDFVVRDGSKVVQAVQVCYRMDFSETRDREIGGLIDALVTYNLSNGFIVTSSAEEDILIGDKTIHVVPAWKWLLRS